MAIKTKNETITLRIEDDLKKQINEIAYKNGCTLSKYINNLIKREVKKHKK